MPEQIKKWITVNGKHIPLDDEGNPITETGKKTLGTETGDNVKESGGVKYSKTFAEYKKEYGGDSFEAARAFFKNELHGKSVRCKTNDGEQEAFFTSKSWGKLKYDMKNDPLKAEILPLIPDILTTGEYSFRELHKERKDNISSFYTYHKIVQTSEGGKDAIVDVAVRPSHPIKYGVYNLTREGSYNYQKRKEYQEIENASAAHPGLSPRGAKAGNDSVVKDSITHILEVVSIRFADEGEEKEVKDDMPRDKPLSDRIAFDAQSGRRHKDGNGYLRIDASNITKEQVAPYYGYEVPGCERLGLEPNRLYYMYRPADELAKAAGSFDGMPLLFEHHETSAARPAKQYVIGSLGTDAEFRAPYLVNSLIITDGEAIDAIERGEYKQLSAAYMYTPVMQGGIFGGEHYDGRMTDIRANHVALVKEGRAGPDVAVADAKPATMKSGAASPKRRITKDMRKTVKNSRALALDAVPAIENMEVNLASFMKAVQAVEAQREGLDPREMGLDMDADASVEEIVEKFFPDADDDVKVALAAQLEALKTAPATDTEAKPAADDEDGEKQESFAEGVEYGEKLIRNPDERQKTDREHESEGMRRAMDECGIDAEDPASSKAFAEGVKYGERLMRNNAEREKLDREHEAEGMKKAMEEQRAAMDAQIKSTRDRALSDMKKHCKALFRAAQDCRPFIGALADPMTFDSADDIYRKALAAAGVETRDVHPSAFPAMLKMARANMTQGQGAGAPLAMDAKAGGEHFKGALEGLARIAI